MTEKGIKVSDPDDDGEERDTRGFLRGFVEDYRGLLGIVLFIVIATVLSDPHSVGRWFGQLVAGFSGK